MSRKAPLRDNSAALGNLNKKLTFTHISLKTHKKKQAKQLTDKYKVLLKVWSCLV